MKFIVSSSVLLKQLSVIQGVITANPVVPILENFLFEISDGILTITTSDLQTSIIAELKVEASEKGSIAVPAKILLDTLKNLPEQPITFSMDESSYTIQISSDNGHYKLAGENTADFPKVPDVKADFSVDKLSTEVLYKAINSCLFATSSDELRPAMTGVYINFDEDNTTFVGTDAHKLIRYKRVDVTTNNGHSIIIPRKGLTLLKNILPTENTTIKLDFNVSNAFFEFGNIKMICRLIDERYPDYENVIPLENPIQMIIDRMEILGSLKRIVIYSNRTTHQVRLKITGSELVISAEDIDFSNEANEHLACSHTGEDIEIGFNAQFLIEMLSNVDSKEIKLLLSSPSKAGLIIPQDQDKSEDLLMLIMPVMLNNHTQ